MVVIKLYNVTMVCLMIHTFGLEGLSVIPQQQHRDYVSTTHDGAPVVPENFGSARCIRTECSGPRPLHPVSVIHLLDPIHIRYSQKIFEVGRVPQGGFEALMLEFNPRQSSNEPSG